MIPLSKTLLPLRMMLHRVVECRGSIRAQHAKEIEDHPHPRPVVIALETPDEEDDAKHHSHQNPTAMRRSIPYLFPLRISDHFYDIRGKVTKNNRDYKINLLFYHKNKYYRLIKIGPLYKKMQKNLLN